MLLVFYIRFNTYFIVITNKTIHSIIFYFNRKLTKNNQNRDSLFFLTQYLLTQYCSVFNSPRREGIVMKMNLTYFIKRLSCRKWLVSWFLNSNLTTSNVINANIISVCSIQIPDLDQDRPRKILEWRHSELPRINWTVHFDASSSVLDLTSLRYGGKVTEVQFKKIIKW